MLDSTTIGAMISPEQAEKTLKYIQIAKNEVRHKFFQTKLTMPFLLGGGGRDLLKEKLTH